MLEGGEDPFGSEAFRADLALLVESGREASRRFAADAVLLARLAGQVPREPGDERGGTAWTSFLREVAVARRAPTGPRRPTSPSPVGWWR